MLSAAHEVPLDADAPDAEQRAGVHCRACHRPVSSARACRERLGGGCRRKASQHAVRRPGRFTVPQEPLPAAPPGDER